MKVNTKDTDSLFEKSFAKYPFNYEKKTSMSNRFNESFSFTIHSPLFEKAVEVLAFCISAGSNSPCSSKSSKQLYNFVARNYLNNILHV